MSSDSEMISSGKARPRRRVVEVGEFEVMRIGITPGRSFCKRTNGGSWILKSRLRRRIADASEKARRVKAMTKREAQAARTG